MATITLVATPIFPTRVIPPVPVGPPRPTGGPPDLGTVRVFADRLHQKIDGQPNVLVGEHNGTCLHVRAPNMWLCHANWTLEDVDLTPGAPGGETTGTLVAGGLLDFDAAKFDVAIFGGTGDFARVVGEIHGDFATNENILEFSIVP
jgi:hypothetical protein